MSFFRSTVERYFFLVLLGSFNNFSGNYRNKLVILLSLYLKLLLKINLKTETSSFVSVKLDSVSAKKICHFNHIWTMSERTVFFSNHHFLYFQIQLYHPKFNVFGKLDVEFVHCVVWVLFQYNIFDYNHFFAGW